jgi:hypothetical protein
MKPGAIWLDAFCNIVADGDGTPKMAHTTNSQSAKTRNEQKKCSKRKRYNPEFNAKVALFAFKNKENILN